MRTVGQTVGKMRRMAAEFQGQFMDAMRRSNARPTSRASRRNCAISEQANSRTFDPVAIDARRNDERRSIPVEMAL